VQNNHLAIEAAKAAAPYVALDRFDRRKALAIV
jgi:hypothetical protein